MTHLSITNDEQLIKAFKTNDEFTFEFDGLLYFVEEGVDSYYNYEIYKVGSDVEYAREEFTDEHLDGGSWEDEEIEGFFEFMTEQNEHLKAMV